MFTRHPNNSIAFAKRAFSTKAPRHTPFAIVGGGTAGINITAQLLRQPDVFCHQIRVFEPSKLHYYQPSWTMLGADLCEPELSVRPMKDVMPKGVDWVQASVVGFDPQSNSLRTEDGDNYTYDYLIVATGFEPNYNAVTGLLEACEDEDTPVSTIYDFEFAQKFSEIVKNFKGGKAVFTFPTPPVKCAGAAQKICYLSEERFRRAGVRGNTQVSFYNAPDFIFGVKKYADRLLLIAQSKGIEVNFKHNLVQVKAKERIAVFKNGATGENVEVPFDLLHAVPPQWAPEVIRKSVLANKAGCVDVDDATGQHRTFRNVFSLGDSSSFPTSKTAAAVFSQTPVILKNLLAEYRKDKDATKAEYEGYTSCPIFVGDGKLMLCEFKYDGVVDETFGGQETPRKFFYWLKTKFFPFVYWNVMPKGIWFGRRGIFNPIPN